MPYSPRQLEQLAGAYRDWSDRQDDLALRLMSRRYASERAGEYAMHGISRRLSTLQHCIDRTFRAVPPTEVEPNREALVDATCYIQTFVINTYGVIDNFAHLWCAETGARDRRGRPLRPAQIGLMPGNDDVRASFSIGFRAYLAGHDEWFGYLEGYRHSLAHRIPLYIPPRQLGPRARDRFRELEQRKAAAFASRDTRAAGDIQIEMQRLGTFEPCIMHSFGEGARPMRFHPQMVCDLATVVEIGEQLMIELDRQASAQPS